MLRKNTNGCERLIYLVFKQNPNTMFNKWHLVHLQFKLCKNVNQKVSWGWLKLDLSILQEGDICLFFTESSRQPLCCVLGIIGWIKPAYSLFQMLECQVGRQWVPFYSLWYDPTRDQPTSFRSDTTTKPLSFTQCSFRFVNFIAVSHCTTCKYLSSNWPEPPPPKKHHTVLFNLLDLHIPCGPQQALRYSITPTKTNVFLHFLQINFLEFL